MRDMDRDGTWEEGNELGKDGGRDERWTGRQVAGLVGVWLGGCMEAWMDKWVSQWMDGEVTDGSIDGLFKMNGWTDRWVL